MGGVSAAVSKTAAAPIERVKLLIQVSSHAFEDFEKFMRKAKTCAKHGKGMELYS